MIFNPRAAKMMGYVVNNVKYFSSKCSYINVSITVKPVLVKSIVALLSNTLRFLVEEEESVINLQVSDRPFDVLDNNAIENEFLGHNDDNAFGGEI